MPPLSDCLVIGQSYTGAICNIFSKLNFFSLLAFIDVCSDAH